ncbi:hypothetical protein BMS3Abin14_00052 [bacterium BMS3Abin14]|nr:hypothetical protein BMS3Abin14_00052 [bacterium BMS3Abin14]
MEASPRVPTTAVQPLKDVPNLEELNLVAYDYLKWGLQRERIINEFSRRYPQFR